MALEALEPRILLSGNVDVKIFGGNVYLLGDRQANNVIVSVEAGNIVVTGNDGTTINGSADPFALRAGSTEIGGNLRVALGNGDDIFVMRGGIQVDRNLFIHAGSGNDQIGIDDVHVLKNSYVSTAGGDDSVAVSNSNVDGSLSVDLSSGDDTLAARSTAVGNDLRIRARGGDDTLTVDQSTIDDRLVAITGSGPDTVSMTHSTIRNDAVLIGGRGSKFVSIADSTIGDNAVIVTSRNSDSIQLTGSTTIGGNLIGVSGASADQLQIDSTVAISGKTIRAGAESDQVPASVVDARLNDPQTGAIAKANAAFAVFGAPVSLAIDPINLSNSDLTESRPNDFFSRDSQFTISGQTAPNTTIEVARDGDHVFDDGSTQADADGNFSVVVTLLNNAANHGENQLVVRAAAIKRRRIRSPFRFTMPWGPSSAWRRASVSLTSSCSTTMRRFQRRTS